MKGAVDMYAGWDPSSSITAIGDSHASRLIRERFLHHEEIRQAQEFNPPRDENEAIRVHLVNHPAPGRYEESVWDKLPKFETDANAVVLFASTDCQHFSPHRPYRFNLVRRAIARWVAGK